MKVKSPRELLIVNPNANVQVTAWLVTEARRLIHADWEIVALNADSGLAAIETPADVRLASDAVEAAVRTRPGASRVLIAAFADPGLQVVRARRSIEVVGLGEAGLQAASQGGRRLSIVTMGEVMREPIAEKAALHGVASQLASIRILPFSIAEFVANRDALRPVVEAQARACLATDGADVVLLGGGPFAGMAHAIELETDLPLLDGVEASIARLTGENSLWSSGNIRV